MRAAGIALLTLVALVGVVFGLRWVFAEPSGQLQAREATVGNGAYRIAAYEQFYEDCASARTVQQNLATAQKAATADNVDPTRQAQLDANVTALSNQLNRVVNDYNAHARETDTRAHFLSSDLPFQLDASTPIDCTR